MIERTLRTLKVTYFRTEGEPKEVLTPSWLTVDELSLKLATELMWDESYDETIVKFTVEEVN